MLKLNIRIDYFHKRLRHFRTKSTLEKIKLACINLITNRLRKIGNNSKIKMMRNKYLKLKIKMLMTSIKQLIMNKNDVQKKFRNYYLYKNLFEFLRQYTYQEIKQNDSLISRFICYQLKRKIMNLLKKYLNLIKRQDRILNNLKRFYFKNRKRKLRSIFKDWKKYYICQKFRKFKNLQMKVKIFYCLKFTLLNK